jgi:hypothetical protein
MSAQKANRISPESWHGWRLEPDIPALVFETSELHRYQIDLDRMRDSAAVLFWIYQIHSKPWGVFALLGFLEAVYDVLDPQKNLCVLREGSEFTAESIRGRVAEYVRTGM